MLTKELELLGSHGIQAFRYADLLQMIGDDRLNPRRLVQRTISLEEAPRELEAMGRFQSTGITVIDRF